MAKLLDSVSVDTNGDPVGGDGAGKGLAVWATAFGGGTVAIEISPDEGTTWIPATYDGLPAVFTANAARYIVKIGNGELIRATLTGSTGASNVNAEVFS